MTDPATLWPGFGIPAEQTPARSLEIRNALEALARTQLTTDDAYPVNPREGMFRVLNDPVAGGNIQLQLRWASSWETFLQNIQSGIPAPSKQVAAGFAAVPTTPWVVDHNLGSKPLVQVYDLSFNQLTQRRDSKQEIRFLGRIPLGLPFLLPGPLRTGLQLPANGILLSLFAHMEEPISGPGDVLIQFDLPATVGPLTPEGDINVFGPVPVGGPPVPGVPITTANGTFGAGDTLDIGVLVNIPPPDGAVELYGNITRTLAADEYQLQHVTDDRFTVDFAGPTSGFVVLVG